MPLLGYDVDPRGSKLIVNEDEAVRVRTIYELYLEHRSLLAVIQELENRGWLNKRWVTRKGTERGGKTFTKSSLHKLLTNVTYIGKLRYKDEVHEGEHAGIVDPETWQRVQSLLQRNGRTGGALVRNRFGALLKGLLRCVPCDAAMVPTHTKKPDGKRYRYYVCSRSVFPQDELEGTFVAAGKLLCEAVAFFGQSGLSRFNRARRAGSVRGRKLPVCPSEFRRRQRRPVAACHGYSPSMSGGLPQYTERRDRSGCNSTWASKPGIESGSIS